MKKIFPLIMLALVLVQCSSIKTNNRIAAKTFTPEQLKRDVDFTYRKLQKLQPQLYWYISKKDLDHKFDSLKTTITKPLNGFEFYKKLSPVVASIRQGHLSVSPVTKILTKAESAALMKKGVGPFSQFEIEMIDGRLYIVKNRSYDKSIQPGFEIIAINDRPTEEILSSYQTWFASDGFNETFKAARINKSFPMMYSGENGLKDSIAYTFRYNDSVKTVNIRRSIVDSIKPQADKKPARKKALTSAEKDKLKKEQQKKSIYGYNPSTKLYNRELKFMEADSSIAVMKIRGFSIGNYYSFYRDAFAKIKKHGSKTLIIDLRDNPGGRLSEIHNLYGYLADTTFIFTEPAQVTKKTSLFAADYFSTGSIATKAIKTIVSPLYYGYTFFKTKKGEDGKYYYKTSDARPTPPQTNSFKGKVYVLINGGSFSASSIISSNLKGSGRAYFVGQETGGAYNGTVAGKMPVVALPNSRIKIRIGLMFICPVHKTDTEGRGIFPDTEIIPTLSDRLTGDDPEMNWVIEDIRKNDQTDLSAENN